MNKIKLFFLGFILSISFFACNSQAEESKEVDAKTVKAEPTEVSIAQVEEGVFEYLIEVNGKVEPAYEIKLMSERAGHLLSMAVKEGDFVRKGSVIAQLDQDQALLDLAKAEVQVQKTKVEYDLQAENMDMVRSRMEVNEELLLANVRARTGLKEAEIALEEAKLQLSKTRILAPADGQIANLKVKRGAYLNSAQEIGDLLSTQELLVRVKVLESDLPYLKSKVKAQVFPVGLEGKQGIEASLFSINPQVDEHGMVAVILKLQDTRELLPGMNVRAILRIADRKSLMVPKEALVYRSGKPVVFTVENDQAKWNYVTPGKDNGQKVEILEGLNAQATVITSNNLQIAHDARVRLKKGDF